MMEKDGLILWILVIPFFPFIENEILVLRIYAIV